MPKPAAFHLVHAARPVAANAKPWRLRMHRMRIYHPGASLPAAGRLAAVLGRASTAVDPGWTLRPAPGTASHRPAPRPARVPPPPPSSIPRRGALCSPAAAVGGWGARGPRRRRRPRRGRRRPSRRPRRSRASAAPSDRRRRSTHSERRRMKRPSRGGKITWRSGHVCGWRPARPPAAATAAAAGHPTPQAVPRSRRPCTAGGIGHGCGAAARAVADVGGGQSTVPPAIAPIP